MKIKEKIRKIILAYFLLILVLVLAAAYFLYQARSQQRAIWSTKTADLISENMPIGFVAKRFGLSEKVIFQELKLPDNRWNRRYTISEACRKSKLDCALVIENLNKLILK